MFLKAKFPTSAMLLALTGALTLLLPHMTADINQALLEAEPSSRKKYYSKLRKELLLSHTPSARRKVKAIGQRENRWMQDVNHQVSKALVRLNPKHTLFVIEDLMGGRNATERVKTQNRYVSVSWSFYDIEQKLIYKAKQNSLW